MTYLKGSVNETILPLDHRHIGKHHCRRPIALTTPRNQLNHPLRIKTPRRKKARQCESGPKTYEDSSSDQLASAIGRVAVGRDQQRHVIMLLLLINPEAQHYNIQERRVWQRHAPSSVIISSTELQLVHAGTVVVALQQRRVDAAVAVGQCAVHQFQLLAFDTVQLDLDRAARAAMRGIQYVSGQTSHVLVASCSNRGQKILDGTRSVPAVSGNEAIKTL